MMMMMRVVMVVVVVRVVRVHEDTAVGAGSLGVFHVLVRLARQPLVAHAPVVHEGNVEEQPHDHGP